VLEDRIRCAYYSTQIFEKHISGGDSKKAGNHCWRCGAHDHFSRDCSDVKDAPEQEVVRGTNLVSMVSIVIPRDTLDNDDSLTCVNEDISSSESRVMLSFNSDNDSAVEAVKVTVNANIAAAAKSLPQDYILLDTCGVQISSATPIYCLTVESQLMRS
jgi:hypothetical protein